MSAAFVETGVQTVVQTGVETATQAGVETVVETGVETALDASHDASLEASLEASVEAGVETDVEIGAAQAAGPSQPLYARADFRRVAGEALRPGGLALTCRALGLAALPQNALVADLGCGPGATARLLARAGHRVLALDLSDASLAVAQGPGVTAICASGHRLPLASGCLDAVFCECVLSAADAADSGAAESGSADKILAETARVLSPGGVLVVSDLYLRGLAGAPGLSAAGAAGGCLAGARGREELEAGLAACGLALFVFEDHSRLLAELAGRLIFAGMSPAGLSDGCRSGARPGYFLCLARKTAPGAP